MALQNRHQITTADLREIMTEALERRHASADYIAGYIAAHELCGWLRPSCPQWIRDTAALHYLLPPANTPDRIQ